MQQLDVYVLVCQSKRNINGIFDIDSKFAFYRVVFFSSFMVFWLIKINVNNRQKFKSGTAHKRSSKNKISMRIFVIGKFCRRIQFLAFHTKILEITLPMGLVLLLFKYIKTFLIYLLIKIKTIINFMYFCYRCC